MEIEKLGSTELEVEIAEFHLDEFKNTDPDCPGSEWDWWLEPETCDLDLLGMGPDEALDFLSDLVIEWQNTQT